jgi:hypothetical protein
MGPLQCLTYPLLSADENVVTIQKQREQRQIQKQNNRLKTKQSTVIT